MRARTLIAPIFALLLASAARAQDPNAMAQAYAVEAADAARKVLLTEFTKHPERMRNVSLTFTLRVDAQGRPHNVQIVSKTRNAWAADTARRALSAAKFPPIPKKILRAFQTDGANIQADFDANAAAR